MSGESVSTAELMTLFEAARWAPSTYNEQEWRYLYATQGSENWATFFGLLAEPNQKWCDKAAVLVVICSSTKLSQNGKDNPVHSFDSGASFENLCLQAAEMELVAHGMAGFDFERTKQELQIPDDFSVEAMIAIGRPGKVTDLPQALQEKETPSSRKPLNEIVGEGKFSF